MVYEVNAICPKCDVLDYDGSRYFKYCPDCGSKVKIVAHCWDCGAKGTENQIHTHHCKCSKHNKKYKRYGGLLGEFECPQCRKERLERELKSLSTSNEGS
jgi:Zn finger protein HypA/HybF involved in hydrogenase expression